jgi:biopolymer transport protein ExbD
MRFSRAEDQASIRLDGTPMSDIIFNLLIFFLLTSTFAAEQGIPLDLPKAVQPSSIIAREVVVTLTRGEGLFVNDKPVGWPALETELSQALARASDRTVVVRGDGAVPLRRVVEVMDTARRLGARGLAIAAQAEDPVPAERMLP